MADKEPVAPPGARLRSIVLSALALAAITGIAALAFRPLSTPATVRIVAAPTEDREIRAQISGAVARPGVYSLRSGDRIEDLIAAAGGPAPDADLSRVALPTRVHDEDQVFVPRRGPTASEEGLVALNSASAAELESLPGIGPRLAERIVQSRDQQGPFRSVDDLRERRIVGPTVLDRLRPLVSLD